MNRWRLTKFFLSLPPFIILPHLSAPQFRIMTVGRRSAFSATARTIAAILLAGFLPGVKADCWIDSRGFERCDRLSTAARVGIGIGFFILFLALIFSLVTYRRRRAAQANLAYVHQNQPQGGNVYNAYGGQPPYGPQYPPPAHGGPGYAYDPTNSGFAPPAGSPPQYYPPPPGAPPIDQHKGPYHV
ncbi:hypothetical protein BJY52DRAFT_1272947 [Lactarius psammicola]|nr:hypothetical protein BJY52DRAFT_1272947 [Lactarius psammicola]